MAEVVHAEAALNTASVSNSTTFTTRLTLSAATLTGAGFAANDEVIVFVMGCYNQSNVATAQSWRLNYNGSTIGPTTAPVIFSANFADNGRVQGWMTRLSLGGTVADFTLQNLRAGTSANVTIEKARIVVLKAADLGTENTDWFWNKSTTNVAHTTTYSSTNRASITWTPASSTEDWLVFFSDNINIDTITVRTEGRVMLDGSTLVAGDYAEEGEDLTEIWTHLGIGIMENLSTSSHTIAYESRDDVATAANDHLESSLLLIRAGKFPDLKWDTPADNATAATTAEIVANVTASLSEAQDALIVASMRIDIGTVDSSNHMWLEDNGTPIEPNLDPGAGPDFSVSNSTSFDAVDEPQNLWLGISARSTGAQDLEMWVQSGVAANAEEITLVLWGLELGGTSATPTPATVNAVAGIPAATVTATATKTATTVNAVAAVPQATAGVSVTKTATTVTAPAGIPTPTVTASVQKTATTVNAVTGIPAVTKTATAEKTAVTVNAVTGIPAPTVTATATAAPSTVNIVAFIPTPVVLAGGGATATPTTVNAVTTIPQATATGGAVHVAGPVNAVTGIPTPTLTATGTAAPSTVNVVVTIPTPTTIGAVLPPYWMESTSTASTVDSGQTVAHSEEGGRVLVGVESGGTIGRIE